MELIKGSADESKNPFLKYSKFTVYKKDEVITFTSDSERVSKFSTTNSMEWEKTPYVKVYTEGNLEKLYSMLSPTSAKLVLFIQLRIKKDTDYIELKPDDAMTFLKVESLATYYKYLNELIDSAVITRGSQAWFWVNPNLIFNGNRVEYYKKHCPECIEVVDINEIKEKKTVKKKKELMKLTGCKNYYQLKMKLGPKQIDKIIQGQLLLSDAIFLN